MQLRSVITHLSYPWVVSRVNSFVDIVSINLNFRSHIRDYFVKKNEEMFWQKAREISRYRCWTKYTCFVAYFGRFCFLALSNSWLYRRSQSSLFKRLVFRLTVYWRQSDSIFLFSQVELISSRNVWSINDHSLRYYHSNDRRDPFLLDLPFNLLKDLSLLLLLMNLLWRIFSDCNLFGQWFDGPTTTAKTGTFLSCL
jgi:hypothetical protein